MDLCLASLLEVNLDMLFRGVLPIVYLCIFRIVLHIMNWQNRQQSVAALAV